MLANAWDSGKLEKIKWSSVISVSNERSGTVVTSKDQNFSSQNNKRASDAQQLELVISVIQQSVLEKREWCSSNE